MLLQTLWVGGIWILHFLVLPGLYSAGLALLLIEEITSVLMPQMAWVALVCVMIQAGLLVRLRRFSALWGERRGQLLLAALATASALLASLVLWPDAIRWQLFSYWLLAFFGLLLVLQPVPRKAAKADPPVG
ncbi:hypothetical protein SAMN05216588_105202 [Pseudomonas flavescens]|uniref:Uncharacterized protein n=1 Tax=Phytopseudomonas flavescens TaxID=29435 RepID=A0A1G8DBG3_9GAMM|nr:DUF4149 domain-containing protein [Pseudomonas flavescens]SDH55001.1 hypothetical protein SAMN05216588_105202 [Pseudomonas flavescens]